MKMVNKMILALSASLFISQVAMAAEKPDVPEFLNGTTRVSAEELIDLVDSKPNLVVLDSRKASDYQKGFIEGAISLPNTETNAGTLAQHVKSKSNPILFYCNGVKCGRSVKAAKIAIAEGYSNIFWFRGGMEEWEAKGLPVVKP